MIFPMVKPTSPPLDLSYEIWRSEAGLMLSLNQVERPKNSELTGWRESEGHLLFECDERSFRLSELPQDALAAFFSRGLLIVEFDPLGPANEHWAGPPSAAPA